MNHREKLDDFCQDDQAVPDLDKVFALKTDHQSLGNLVMPLVTDMSAINKDCKDYSQKIASSPEVLEVNSFGVCVVLRGSVGHLELGDEARVAGTLPLK